MNIIKIVFKIIVEYFKIVWINVRYLVKLYFFESGDLFLFFLVDRV